MALQVLQLGGYGLNLLLVRGVDLQGLQQPILIERALAQELHQGHVDLPDAREIALRPLLGPQGAGFLFQLLDPEPLQIQGVLQVLALDFQVPEILVIPKRYLWDCRDSFLNNI
jgi:hypothetical protein